MRWPPPYLSTAGSAALLAGSALVAGVAGGLPGGLDTDDVALALQMAGFLVVFVLVQPPSARVPGVPRTHARLTARPLVVRLLAVAVALPAWYLAVAWALGELGAGAGARSAVVTALVCAAVGVVLVLATWGLVWRRARREPATGWGGSDTVA